MAQRVIRKGAGRLWEQNINDNFTELFDRTVTKPFVLLCLGQSNMRSDTGATGGNYQLYPYIFVREGDGETLGNAWTTPEVGEFPFDQTSDGINFANSYPYGIAREIHERTGRPVCLIIVAKGSHPAVAFVTPAGRTANGWSLDPSFSDLSQAMYPGIADALTSVGASQVDAVCIHQGEADKADFDTWVAQWSVVFDELEAAGVYNRTDTRVTIGAMTDCPANAGYRIAQFEAALTLSALHLLDNAAYVDANKLPIVASSQLHFTGDGLVALAKRTADKLLGPRLPFESWKIDGSIGPSGDVTMEIADAKTGGNVSATALNGVYQIERRMIWDAKTGRAVGIGGDVRVCVNCNFVDTTGLTPGNTLYLRGLPVPCRNGANSLFYGSADAQHTSIGDGIVPAIVGSGTSEILFRKLATGAASSTLTVADLTSGAAKLRVQINYAAKVGTIAYL